MFLFFSLCRRSDGCDHCCLLLPLVVVSFCSLFVVVFCLVGWFVCLFVVAVAVPVAVAATDAAVVVVAAAATAMVVVVVIVVVLCLAEFLMNIGLCI